MTREEAIEVLKLVDENASCDDCLYYAQMEDCPTDEDCIIRQALEMAIQALSQVAICPSAGVDCEDCPAYEPCDAISRDMALEKMADYVASGYADSAEDFEEYSRIICQLPSVTQKSKTGHWINLEKKYKGQVLPFWGRYGCSKCGGYGEGTFNYCPNCGAKMESEDKE